jgi:hypothetical protein
MKKDILVTIIITAFITFIICAWLSVYQGKSASDWYAENQKTENLRQADYNAIYCIRGLGYLNLPSLGSYYTNLNDLKSTDPTDTYYSKYQVDNCLYGL